MQTPSAAKAWAARQPHLGAPRVEGKAEVAPGEDTRVELQPAPSRSQPSPDRQQSRGEKHRSLLEAIWLPLQGAGVQPASVPAAWVTRRVWAPGCWAGGTRAGSPWLGGRSQAPQEPTA